MLLLCYFECAPHCSAECDKRIFTGEGNHFPQNRQRLSRKGEPAKPSGFDGAGRSGEALGGGHLGDLGAVGLESFLPGGKVQTQRLGGLGIDGDDAVIKGLVGQVCGCLLYTSDAADD